MKIDPGMYIRTIDGAIAKVTDNKDNVVVLTEDNTTYLRGKIVKASYQIFDLIEVGDYVNGRLVIRVRKNSLGVLLGYRENRNEKNDIHIKTIVTHEQFDNMKYEVK